MDTHCDSLGRVTDDGVDLGVRSNEGHVDFRRLAEGGVDAQVFAVWVAPEYWAKGAKARALKMIDAFDRSVEAHPDLVAHARTASGAKEVADSGKIAVFLGLEGGYAIEDDPGALAMFYERGVRYMTLTWWNNTNWADGSGDEPRWGGLSDLGQNIVKEMNRLGMIVDVSHASEGTFWDVLKVTEQPVIASHSNAAAINNHHRNLTDKQLRAIAENGGVVGVNFVSGFLDADFFRRREELEVMLKPRFDLIDKKHGGDKNKAGKERWALISAESKKLDPVSIDKVIDHIDHIVKTAGVDHVGLGSDFDGFSAGPTELGDCTKYPEITRRLLKRGYSEEDVAKILGGNFLRVFKKVIR